MYRIGDFSKLSKTTVKTLRYYGEIGLLQPEEIDESTGYRFYTSKQLFKLHRIQALRQIGISIDEIKKIVSGHNPNDILEKRKSEMIALLSETNDQLSRLEFILQGKQEEEFMKFVAIIKELPECIVYSLKMTVPDYNSYFNLIPALGEKVLKKYPDLKCTIPEYCFISYLDGEYKEKDINIEFCEAVDQLKPDFDGIVFKKIDAVTAVSIMYKGPYSELFQAYSFAFNWIEQNGYTTIDSPRENYIDGIWNKDDMSEWLTELQIPITKSLEK